MTRPQPMSGRQVGAFAEALQRLNKHLLAGEPLRVPNIRDNGARLLDVNNDRFVDVVIGNNRRQLTRVWSAEGQNWTESEFPAKLTDEDRDNYPWRKPWEDGFGVLRADAAATYWRAEKGRLRAWSWDGSRWAEELSAGIADPSPFNSLNWLRLHDLDRDGKCELLMKRFEQDDDRSKPRTQFTVLLLQGNGINWLLRSQLLGITRDCTTKMIFPR